MSLSKIELERLRAYVVNGKQYISVLERREYSQLNQTFENYMSAQEEMQENSQFMSAFKNRVNQGEAHTESFKELFEIKIKERNTKELQFQDIMNIIAEWMTQVMCKLWKYERLTHMEAFCHSFYTMRMIQAFMLKKYSNMSQDLSEFQHQIENIQNFSIEKRKDYHLCFLVKKVVKIIKKKSKKKIKPLTVLKNFHKECFGEISLKKFQNYFDLDSRGKFQIAKKGELLRLFLKKSKKFVEIISQQKQFWKNKLDFKIKKFFQKVFNDFKISFLKNPSSDTFKQGILKMENLSSKIQPLTFLEFEEAYSYLLNKQLANQINLQI